MKAARKKAGRKKMIVVASEVTSRAAVLQQFLDRLGGLKFPRGHGFHFYFLDRGADPTASRLLEEWCGRFPRYTTIEKSAGGAGNLFLESARRVKASGLLVAASNLLFHPHLLTGLMDSSRDIVGAVLWNTWETGIPREPNVWMVDNRRLYTSTELPVAAHQALDLIAKLREPGVYQVGGVNTCFFLSEAVLKSGLTFDRLDNVSFEGEDVHFCLQAAARGFDIWADSRFPVYALGNDLEQEAFFKGREAPPGKRRSSKPKRLTVCTIARNEAKNLPRMIRSIEKIADEVIVTDTGSTDGTTEVAESLGAVVVPCAWRGDFAVARNSAIREASGQWVLSLDADEELDPDSVRELDRIVRSGVLALYSLKIVNWIQERAGAAAVSQFMHRNMRLFPRIPGCGYQWPIHEQLTSSLVPLPRMLAEVTLFHHGYASPETRLRKSHRNLEILRKAVRDDPSNSFHWFNLAMSYEGLGRSGDALESFLRSIELAPGRAPFKSILYVHTALNLNYLGRFLEALPYAAEALRIEPYFPDAHFVRGNAYAGLREYPKALEAYRKATETPPEIMDRLEGSDVGVATWKAWNQMGLVHTYMKDHRSAVECFEKALADPRPDARLLVNAATSHEALGNGAKAEEYYRRALEVEPANPHLYHGLVKLYLAHHRNDAAIEVMELASARSVPGIRITKEKRTP